ncbi:MAG TPA: aminoacyl-tRNA hydrolase [Burkholderiaceae bacterium]|nr:aminoacyl-tRNA hydrolase [Burkholderiaceae bacterium]
MIKLFVGLGNPGPDYATTRHNAGFWFIDELARLLNVSLSMDKSHFGMVARATVKGQTVWLLQPQTFMNVSGKAVASLSKFFKIAPDEILVIHDELDVPAGQAKVKFAGGHAGHNGLRDIHAKLGTGDYWRLRIGIGHPGVGKDVADWVLKKPSVDERIAIDQTIDRSIKAVPDFLAGDMEKAMLLIHTSKPPRPKPAKPESPIQAPKSQPKDVKLPASQPLSDGT